MRASLAPAGVGATFDTEPSVAAAGCPHAKCRFKAPFTASFMRTLISALFLLAPTLAQAGVTTVPLDPADPDPLVALPGLKIIWNDIHFELPMSPDIDPTRVKMTNETGDDQHWDQPTENPVNSGHYSMSKGANGQNIPADKGAGLQLQSVALTGWGQIKYSRTRDGKTIYSEKTIADDGLATVATGNSFPVNLSAIVLLTNASSKAIASLHLSVNTAQNFTEIGSDVAGEGFPLDGDFVFAAPLETGDSATLFWTYDAFSSTPENDTEVSITATFTAGLVGLASGPGTTRLAHVASPRATLPPVLLREAQRGGFGTTIRLSSGGAYRFLTPGQVQQSAGQITAGTPFIDTNGDLCIPLTGQSATKCAWILSGVDIDTSTTPIGPVRLFLGTAAPLVSAVVGRRGVTR